PLPRASQPLSGLTRETAQATRSCSTKFIQSPPAETGNKRAGSQSVLNRLSEWMFVEVIRMHMDQLANNNTGWLAGLQDPLVGRVLTLLHAAHQWILQTSEPTSVEIGRAHV